MERAFALGTGETEELLPRGLVSGFGNPSYLSGLHICGKTASPRRIPEAPSGFHIPGSQNPKASESPCYLNSPLINSICSGVPSGPVDGQCAEGSGLFTLGIGQPWLAEISEFVK